MSKYLIDFKNDADQSSISNYLTVNNCTVLKIFSTLDNTYYVESSVLPPNNEIIENIIDDDASPIQLLAEVNVVQPDAGYPITLSTSDEKDWWKVYSTAVADFNDASLTLVGHGSGTNVYLVDSGIEALHPEFVGADVSLVYSLTNNFEDNTGHGTALASVIVGKTCGLTDASLKVVKIFDNNQATKQSDLLYAFDSILQDALASTNLVSVVNLSWAIPRNTFIESKINNLIAAGIIVVCASGNSGLPISDVTPAAMPNVFTIGSFNQSFSPSNFADYSGQLGTTENIVNIGALDAWAPGEQIWTALIGGGYGFIGGTSIASAIYSASMAYNASQLIVESGKLLSLYRTDTGEIDNAILTARDRTGLLNLADPKYATSVNKICTFHNDWFAIAALRSPSQLSGKIISNVGSRTAVQFSNLVDTASYEVLSPLPDFISIERTFLIVKPEAEPTSPSHVDVYGVQIKVTPIDVNVAPYTVVITVVVIGTNFNPAVLAEDDPLLEITLLASCFSSSPPTCSGTGCGFSSPCQQTTNHKNCSCLPPGTGG
jgi:subtilisin family serine protease